VTNGEPVGLPFDAATIQQYVTEVAEPLSIDADRHVVVVVGGALLAWRGLRGATRDAIDSMRRNSPPYHAQFLQAADERAADASGALLADD